MPTLFGKSELDENLDQLNKLEFNKNTAHRFSEEVSQKIGKVSKYLTENAALPKYKHLYKLLGIHEGYNNRDGVEAKKYFQKLQSLTEEDPEEYAEVCNFLGGSKLICGDYIKTHLFDTAKEGYEDLEKEAVTTENQLGKVLALRQLTYVYHRTNRDDKAEIAIRAALHIQLSLGNPNPVDLAETYHALGTVLLGRDKLNQAYDVFEKAMNAWEDDYAEGKIKHLAMFVTMQSKAMTLNSQKKYTEAFELLENIHKLQIEAYKTTDHIDIAKTIHFKGEALEGLKRYEEAYNTYQAALVMKLKFHTGDSKIVNKTRKCIEELVEHHPEVQKTERAYRRLGF